MMSSLFNCHTTQSQRESELEYRESPTRVTKKCLQQSWMSISLYLFLQCLKLETLFQLWSFENICFYQLETLLSRYLTTKKEKHYSHLQLDIWRQCPWLRVLESSTTWWQRDQRRQAETKHERRHDKLKQEINWR